MRASQLLLPLLIVVALYFLFLRPQRNRQRAAQALANNIRPGQRVVTTAGMYATVVALDDSGVLLEIAPGVEVRYVRQAISRVVEEEYAPAVTDEEATEEEYGADEATEEEYGEELDGDEPTEEELDADEFDEPAERHGQTNLVDLTKEARPESERPAATRYDPEDAADRTRR